MMRPIRWAWPLVALAGTIGLVWWLWFQRHESSRRSDAELLVYIGAGYLVALAFLLAFTRRWNLRALGQVGTYVGDAMFYLWLGGDRLGWWASLSRGQLNAIRATFAVAVTALIAGLIWWWWATREHDERPPHGGADTLVSIAPERTHGMAVDG